MLSTLDVITRGRIELGIGARWYEEEYNAYGYSYFSNVVPFAVGRINSNYKKIMDNGNGKFSRKVLFH